ncbi:S8/S53 family peptidase [Flindersiella endophytica]
MYRRIAAAVTAVAVAACLGAHAAPSSAAPAAPVRAAAAGSAATAAAQSVTLVTGDTVWLRKQANGRQAGEFVPGEGRDAIAFQQSEIDGDLYIYPEDVLPLLDSRRLDPALFNVTELVSQGYDDRHQSAIPLILSYRKGIDAERTVTTQALRAADVGAALESINGRAVAADKGDAEAFWASITSPSARSLDGGIDRIWLDRKLKADLEHSVPQIGAPEAWEAGYDGTGVTVGVLDTGVDTAHPDLEGVVAATKNFTDSPTTQDRFGHGTHVSATIAGTGSASAGRRKGVAPGAKLVVGKVLDDDGYGYESWILDGMEWAIDAGASVVNMSLGGGPTDGTDPLSAGVNTLSATTGALFVCSAGNDGEQGEFTIGTPGAADAALTVGAVDRDEALAPFSSRGPREGDFAVKPDITAPGVGIVAARAGGTAMGTPVDTYYTAASGTSMAAPHVAGAAAILAQRHPDWTGAQLKDGLASTSLRNDSLTVYEQGGGRVDVERAVSQGVYGTATLDLGHLPANADAGEVRRTVTYTNTTDSAVRLALSLVVKGPGGNPPAPGSITTEASSVEVAPGSTLSVPVSVRPDLLARGRYGGYLEARTDDGAVAVHTSLGLMRDAPKHKVSFTAVGRDGKPATVIPFTFYGEDSRYDSLGYLPAGATKTVEVAEGTYFLHGVISGGRAPDEEDYVIVDPAVSVSGDLNIVLDARKANQVVIQTPKPSRQSGALSFYSHRDFGSRSVSHFHMEFDTVRNIYVTPTSTVTSGSFEFGTRWQKIAPMLTVSANGQSLEPFYVHQSPVLEGRKRLRAVYVGAGALPDYEGKNVRGKLVVVSATKENWEELTSNAAAAGAAMALIVVKPTGSPWTKWTPKGDRLPTMSVLVSNAQGAQLIAALSAGRVDVDLNGQLASPYLYDVMQVSRQRVPEQVVYRVSTSNSATVSAAYHDAGGGDWAKEQRFGWRPWQDSAINQYQRLVRTPQTRQELITAGDTVWQQNVKHFLTWDEMQKLSGGMTQAPRTYRAGERVSDSWFSPVVRPSIPRGVPGAGATRVGDVLRLRIPEWVDSGSAHYGLAEGDWGAEPDQGHAKLYRDGALVYEGDWAWGDFETVAGSAEYRLEMNVRRESAEWEFAPRTDTAWTFRSERASADDDAVALPLLQVDYDVTTDLRNRTVAGLPFVIDLTARQQDGVSRAAGVGAVKSMALWTSYDDGATWTRASVFPVSGGRYRALVWHPRLDRTNGFVTLRVRAEDKAGNAIDQTVGRAYGLR